MYSHIFIIKKKYIIYTTIKIYLLKSIVNIIQIKSNADKNNHSKTLETQEYQFFLKLNFFFYRLSCITESQTYLNMNKTTSLDIN